MLCKDSYSVGDRCYCDITGDHNVYSLAVDIPLGNLSTETVGDKDYCSGRVDIGKDGCAHIDPKWNFD